MIEILVVYDVATDDASGRKRLRRVAQACEAYGQRVQKSVFECSINETAMELLIARLRSEIDITVDSIRIYRLREPLARHLRMFGVQPSFDQRDPLVF